MATKLHPVAAPTLLTFEAKLELETVGLMVDLTFEILEGKDLLPAVPEGFTRERVTQYLETLIYLKVNRLTGGTAPTLHFEVNVPFWFKDLIDAIGPVFYDELNVEIVPSYQMNIERVLNVPELAEVSKQLALIKRYYPMEPVRLNGKGDPDFMEVVVLADRSLRSIKEQSAAHVFLSTIAKKRILDEAANVLFRKYYGDAGSLNLALKASDYPRLADPETGRQHLERSVGNDA